MPYTVGVKLTQSILVSVLVIMCACASLDAPTRPREEPANSNQVPIAIANPGGPVIVGHDFPLDGSASFDPDGESLEYLWVSTLRPPGAAAIPESYSQATAVPITTLGEYKFELTVRDEAGAEATSTVEIQSVVHDPVTIAEGPTRMAAVGTPIHLASAIEPNGATSLSYAWSFLEVPAGSEVDIESPDSLDASFVPDQMGEYRLRVQVTSPWLSSTHELLAYGTADQTVLSFEAYKLRYVAPQNRLYYRTPGKVRVVDLTIKEDSELPFNGSIDDFDVLLDGSRIAIVASHPDIGIRTLDVADPSTGQVFTSFPCPSSEVLFESSESVFLALAYSYQRADLVSGVIEDLGNQPFIGAESRLARLPGLIYEFYQSSSNTGINTIDLSSTPQQLLGNSKSAGVGSVCGNLWPTDDGALVVTRCGDILRPAASNEEHLAIVASLPLGFIVDVAHDPGLGVLAIAQHSADGPTIELVDDTTFLPIQSLAVPMVLHPDAGGVFSSISIRKVFFNSSGQLQVAGATSFANGHASMVVTLTP